jgi:hypothetical protein
VVSLSTTIAISERRSAVAGLLVVAVGVGVVVGVGSTVFSAVAEAFVVAGGDVADGDVECAVAAAGGCLGSSPRQT